ncbi:MAG: hypothetical protein MZU84_09115 [Sphingobacterium sp.]|nr:hypothetical protein [Sphingobacterium sp.]
MEFQDCIGTDPPGHHAEPLPRHRPQDEGRTGASPTWTRRPVDDPCREISDRRAGYAEARKDRRIKQWNKTQITVMKRPSARDGRSPRSRPTPTTSPSAAPGSTPRSPSKSGALLQLQHRARPIRETIAIEGLVKWTAGHEADGDPRAGRRVPAHGFERLHEPDEGHPRHRVAGPRPERPAPDSGQGLTLGRAMRSPAAIAKTAQRRKDKRFKQRNKTTIAPRGPSRACAAPPKPRPSPIDLSLGGAMIQSDEAYAVGIRRPDPHRALADDGEPQPRGRGQMGPAPLRPRTTTRWASNSVHDRPQGFVALMKELYDIRKPRTAPRARARRRTWSTGPDRPDPARDRDRDPVGPLRVGHRDRGQRGRPFPADGRRERCWPGRVTPERTAVRAGRQAPAASS